jgi:hypothetical protein
LNKSLPRSVRRRSRSAGRRVDGIGVGEQPFHRRVAFRDPRSR